MVKVSVCIPVYNGEKYISTTIRSVLDQTYRDFELIVSDNCSDDKTIHAIKKFTDKRIKLIQNKRNIGMYPNFNKCLLTASGRYIKFLNADDYFINARALELFVNVLDRNDDVSLVSCTAISVNESGQFIEGKFSSRTERKICERFRDFLQSTNKLSLISLDTAFPGVSRQFLNFKSSFLPNMKMNGKRLINIIYRSGTDRFCLSPTHSCFRRKMIQDIGLFNEKVDSGWGTETEYWTRILLKSNFYKINSPLVAFRRHHESGSELVFKRKIQFKDLLSNYSLIQKNCGSQLTVSSKVIGRISFNYNVIKHEIISMITRGSVSWGNISWALKLDYPFFLISFMLFPGILLAKKFGNDLF